MSWVLSASFLLTPSCPDTYILGHLICSRQYFQSVITTFCLRDSKFIAFKRNKYCFQTHLWQCLKMLLQHFTVPTNGLPNSSWRDDFGLGPLRLRFWWHGSEAWQSRNTKYPFRPTVQLIWQFHYWLRLFRLSQSSTVTLTSTLRQPFSISFRLLLPSR